MCSVHEFAKQLGWHLGDSKDPIFVYNGLLNAGEKHGMITSFIVTISGQTAELWLTIPDIFEPVCHLRQPPEPIFSATCMDKLHAEFIAVIGHLQNII